MRLARRFLFLDHGARAHDDAPATSLLIILDSRAAVDVAAGREVRTLYQLSDLAGCHLRVVDQRDERGHDFLEIVRRNVGRHADGDARRSVDDEIGDRRRKNFRLLQSIVEVGREIDSVLVDVGEHLHRDAGEARFRIAVSRRRISIDAAEVPLSIDKWVAQRKVLDHAHQRVVDRSVTVRVILAEHVADHGR